VWPTAHTVTDAVTDIADADADADAETIDSLVTRAVS
jgi:hypothetical protein